MSPEEAIRDVIETINEHLKGTYVLGGDDFVLIVSKLEDALSELEED